MNDPVGAVARAAARQLQTQADPGLKTEVEAALATRETAAPPPQYLDTVSLASLIVSVAGLAWTVYTDLKSRTDRPPPDVVARAIRLRLHESGDTAADHVIEVVITETLQAGTDQDHALD